MFESSRAHHSKREKTCHLTCHLRPSQIMTGLVLLHIVSDLRCFSSARSTPFWIACLPGAKPTDGSAALRVTPGPCRPDQAFPGYVADRAARQIGGSVVHGPDKSNPAPGGQKWLSTRPYGPCRRTTHITTATSGIPCAGGTVHWRPWSGRREHVDGGGSFYACVFQT